MSSKQENFKLDTVLSITAEINFKLETVLSVTAEINLVEDFDDIIELYQFVFIDPLISTMTIQILKNSLVNHIFEIHPELAGVKYDAEIDGDLDRWIAIQKAQYGETMPICVIGHTLNKKGKEKVKKIEYYE